MLFYSFALIPSKWRNAETSRNKKFDFGITPSLSHPLPDGMIPKMALRPSWSHLHVALPGLSLQESLSAPPSFPFYSRSAHVSHFFFHGFTGKIHPFLIPAGVCRELRHRQGCVDDPWNELPFPHTWKILDPCSRSAFPHPALHPVLGNSQEFSPRVCPSSPAPKAGSGISLEFPSLLHGQLPLQFLLLPRDLLRECHFHFQLG